MSKRDPLAGGSALVRRVRRQVEQQETARPALVMRSFRFRSDQLERLHARAVQEGVDDSRLLRWLLDRSLQALDQGDWQIPRRQTEVADL